MRNDFKFYVNYNVACAGLDLYIKHDGAWVMSFNCLQIEEGDIAPAALQITESQAQGLMDQLWQAGIRPTAAKGGEATLAATERHLEDMRALAFTKIGVKKPCT